MEDVFLGFNFDENDVPDDDLLEISIKIKIKHQTNLPYFLYRRKF